MPEHPTFSVDVENASVVTNAFSSLGKGVEVLSSLVGIHVDAVISVPFEATLAVMAAAQHPDLAPSVLSYLVQRFVNPAVGPPITAYPWLTEQTVALIASLLPYPLGPNATDPGVINAARLAFADVFNSVLGRLPDPLPGFDAVTDVMNDTALGGVIVAGQLAVRAPVYLVWNTVNYLGNLPVNVEASLESAIQRPDQIPGLVSNLAYGLLSPDAGVGLFGQLLNNVVDPFTWLPKPIGYTSANAVGLANQIRDVVADVMNRVLALLPAPVAPSALPSATAPQGQPTYSVGAGKGSVASTALPPASLSVADSVGASSVTREKPSRTTASKGLALVVDDVAVVKPVTPAADAGVAAGAAGDDVDKLVHGDGVKPNKTKSNKIKSNKIKPNKIEPNRTEPAMPEQGGDSGGSTGDSTSGDSNHPSGNAA